MGQFRPMPVALVTTPDEYALTKGGRMLYEFAGSGRYQTAGVKAVSEFYITAAITEGTKLVLRWNNKAYTLLFTANPVTSNEFSIGNGSPAYVDALLAEFRGYFPMREAYTLTRIDANGIPGIVFTAREPGPQWDVTLTLLQSEPFGFFRIAEGADPLLRVQYSVYAEVWLQKVGSTGDDLDADYERIFPPMIETDAAGLGQFDVGKVLHARLTADWPTWAMPSPNHSATSARKYYICYAEAYGFPVEIGKIQRDQVRYAYLGGADYIRRSGGGLNLLFSQTADPEEDTALRFGDTTRFVRTDEPQYLTFLNSRAAQVGSLLKITRIFDNDGTDERMSLLAAQDVATGQKITYAVGPTQQDLFAGLPAGRTLREYKVQRIDADQTTPLSIEYRFVVNYDYQPYTRYFGYLNSLGAVETLATTGKGSSELARFYDQAERYLPTNYDVQDGQFSDYNVQVQQQVEVTTGFRSEAELRGWTDFYRSPNRFRLLDGRALPISLVSKSIKQAKDGDTLFAHKFEYSYQFRDDFYSEEPETVGALPPLGFVGGGGTVVVQPQTIINAIDATVPNVVRGLTANIIGAYNQAVAWGNHALAGYLTQGAGSQLFRRKDQQIPYIEIANTPTTRDQAGLTDVPTRRDLFKLIKISSHLSSWTGTEIPEEL